MSIVEVRNVSKVFVNKKGPVFRRKKENFRAMDDVSFSIAEGEIFSLLGPNGAGKTTTIKILATLLLPTSGTALVKGFDVAKQDFQVRKIMTSVLPGERTLYWKLTVAENLEYFGTLYGLRSRYVKERIGWLLSFFGLEDKRKTLVEKLSTGQRQKVVLSRALLPRPEVILLDEPTLGLDPNASIQLRGLIRKIASQGTTILLTTHYMYEADELSDHVAIMNAGRIVCLDTPDALKKGLSAKKILRFRIDDWNDGLSKDFQEKFAVRNAEHRKHRQDYMVTVKFDDSGVDLSTVSAFLDSTGRTVRNITVDDPTLEDVFIEKTGTTIGGGEEEHEPSVLV